MCRFSFFALSFLLSLIVGGCAGGGDAPATDDAGLDDGGAVDATGGDGGGGSDGGGDGGHGAFTVGGQISGLSLGPVADIGRVKADLKDLVRVNQMLCPNRILEQNQTKPLEL